VADMKAAKMAIKDYVAFVESFRLNWNAVIT
jgi:hypothetical protein